MNLHETRPWQEPLFTRRFVAPLAPFLACALAVITYATVTDLRAHQELSEAQTSLPHSTAQNDSVRYISDYTQEVQLLGQIYQQQLTTLASLQALRHIAGVMPKSMRLLEVDFPDAPGAAVTIHAELQSPQSDVDEFLNNIKRANYQFNLTSLSPLNNSYSLQGDITVPWTSDTPTSAHATSRPPLPRRIIHTTARVNK
jgi:hypothetical protein